MDAVVLCGLLRDIKTGAARAAFGRPGLLRIAQFTKPIPNPAYVQQHGLQRCRQTAHCPGDRAQPIGRDDRCGRRPPIVH